ncbi:MAG: BNR-4 repeat-containing protein [Prevotella sp.]|nr:BNR-4 repeat-containing protein [Prevotella sp.]
MKKLLLSVFVLLSAAIPVVAQEADSYEGTVVSDEGAWCWFADSRALYYKGVAYVGYIDVHGNVKAAQMKVGQDGVESKEEVLVRSYFQPDDHNNPTFLVLPDERIMIFYTRHTDEAKIWYRISRKPLDITQLGEEKYLATANNTTYPSPFIMSDDPEHIYLCWRGINWHPTIARLTMPDADDNCRFDFGPKQIVQSTGARPYAKYHSNGKDKIYLCYTTGHPDNEQPNWLYFNVIDINKGNGPILRDINGNQLSIVKNGTFNVNKTTGYANSYPSTIVDNTNNIRNWVWQISLDKEERPVIAFTHIDDAKTSHVYWYGRWTGTEWQRTWVQYAGHAFHQNWNSTERCYSGGMAIDPANTNDLYLSIPTKNGVYNKDGVYEIWKYTVGDDGKVTGSEQVTRNSQKNNMRPFVMPGADQSKLRLLWMNGDYYYWMVNKNYPSGYPTSIRMNCEFAAGSYPSLAPLCNESPNVEVTPEDNYLIDPWEHGKFRDADEFTILLNWSLDASAYGGAMLSMGNMEYGVDKKTLKPYVIIDGKTYSSENMLCTSDAWKTESTGTDGKSYMTKHGLFNTAIQYDKATRLLTIYRNGLIDQRFEVEGLMLDKITIGGFKGKLYNYRVYDSSVGISFLEMSLEEGQLEPISVSADVYTDIVLPSKTVNGKELAWRSDREDVISTSGLVTLPETETVVKLTTFIPHGKSYSTSKTWSVTVHPRDINNNLRYQHDETIDLTRNTATGFSTNKYEQAPEGLLDGLRSYTFLLSANAKRLTGQPRLYDFGSSSGNSVFLRANQLSAGIKYNGGTTTMVNGKTSLKANQDYQLAVTFDAATKKTCIYIDGKLDAAGTNNQSEPYQLVENTSDTRNYIGRTQWWDSSVKADNQDFAGTIGGFRLYDIALTKEEINQIQSDITAVKGLNEMAPVWKDGSVYDVCGRRMYADGLHNMKPGLYITQGQKIIVH